MGDFIGGGLLVLYCLIILLIGLMVVGFYYILFRFARRAGKDVLKSYQQGKATSEAMATLNNRLARGEITEDEHRRLKQALERATDS